MLKTVHNVITSPRSNVVEDNGVDNNNVQQKIISAAVQGVCPRGGCTSGTYWTDDMRCLPRGGIL